MISEWQCGNVCPECRAVMEYHSLYDYVDEHPLFGVFECACGVSVTLWDYEGLGGFTLEASNEEA